MVYDTQSYLSSGLCPLSGIKKLEQIFRKLNLFLPSGEGKETSTLLDLLERGNFNPRRWTNSKIF
jgi:hypothetical protein